MTIGRCVSTSCLPGASGRRTRREGRHRPPRYGLASWHSMVLAAFDVWQACRAFHCELGQASEGTSGRRDVFDAPVFFVLVCTGLYWKLALRTVFFCVCL